MEFSHLDKIYFPKTKISKNDVIKYYQQIADIILPYLKDRPVTVFRCPDGIFKECWIQKNAPEGLPKFVKIYEEFSKSAGRKLKYILVNNLETLLWLVNLGSIEFHIWFSKFNNSEKPDWLIFDLDLEKGAKSADAIEVVFLIKEELDKRGLKSWLKTTGITGLHILVPVSNLNYQKVMEWVGKIILKLDKNYPDKIATEKRIAKRKGKIFIDAAQNSRGRTMICPYSLRAKEGASVSAPLDWEELKFFGHKIYNIKTITDRLKEKGDILKPILTINQRLNIKD